MAEKKTKPPKPPRARKRAAATTSEMSPVKKALVTLAAYEAVLADQRSCLAAAKRRMMYPKYQDMLKTSIDFLERNCAGIRLWISKEQGELPK